MTSSSKSRHLFGTDGIRGIANQHPMTSEVALSLGRALAYIFRNSDGQHRKLLIGKDTRLSGYMLETALASGVTSMGADVLLVGPMPTPGVAFLTNGMRAEAGVMISASHNPFQDNGIKVFDQNGYKLPDERERELEGLVSSNLLEEHRPAPEKIGKAFRVEDAKGRYIEYLKGTFPRGRSLDGMRIVLDCANGAAYEIAPTVMSELGARLTLLGVEPDGLNINQGVGALFTDGLVSKVRETGADIGLAVDGDADRVIFVDEKGKVLDGDAILALCGGDLLAKGLLKERVVVATVMSNIGLEKYLKKWGGELLRTPVGDRYLIERMKEGGYLFGGEPSGHLIFRQFSTTGDGILAALQVLSLMQERSRPLSELVADYVSYPQVLKNVRVRRQIPLESCAPLVKKIRQVEEILGREGRLLIRPSGTEPVVRVMIEGQDLQKIERLAQEIAAVVEEHLGGHGSY